MIAGKHTLFIILLWITNKKYYIGL